MGRRKRGRRTMTRLPPITHASVVVLRQCVLPPNTRQIISKSNHPAVFKHFLSLWTSLPPCMLSFLATSIPFLPFLQSTHIPLSSFLLYSSLRSNILPLPLSLPPFSLPYLPPFIFLLIPAFHCVLPPRAPSHKTKEKREKKKG